MRYVTLYRLSLKKSLGKIMLSNELELTLRKALSLATYYRHEYASYEHLLLALLDDKDTKELFVKININIDQLKTKLSDYLENNLPELIVKEKVDTKPSSSFQRIIQRAALHNQANGQEIISGINVLAEFFFEHDSFALLCLKECNLNRQKVVNFARKNSNDIKSLSSSSTETQTETIIANANKIIKDKATVNQSSNSQAENIESLDLEMFCINLNKKAKTNTIDCLIGREAEIQRTIEILCRRKKNNAILIGEPGVGKTAIAEGLATRIISNDVPTILKDAVIYSLDIGSLVAGTKFRGDFEERIKNLLDGLKSNPNAILFIDEIHMIIGAGSTTNGVMDASNLLKPALTKGYFRCIGSTTFKEFHKHFEKDMALVRRFQKVIVNEPSQATTLEILFGLKGYYEKHHNVIYEESALKAAITLSERFIHDRHLPDKAIDLIDEAGARSKIDNNTNKTPIITQRDIEILLSSIINIPDIHIKVNDMEQLKNLSQNLKELIFGQDEAIDNLCNKMKLSRAGLRKGSRPTGCYMFAGSTGVGKTELAKQLANLSSMKLIRFDMSEYSESSSIAKLIGSAPGYVGHEQGGLLTDEVDKHPYCVVLFDEIEKAHPEIFNLLLQIMDDGKLTDNTGKQISFSHSMIILTTNIVSTAEKSAIGFSQEASEAIINMNMDAFNNHFSPEFRSRLDKIILFNPITNISEKIITKNLKELIVQLAEREVKLTVTNAAKKHLAVTYFTNKGGARELDRAIDSHIKQIIADEILFGKLKTGGAVYIDFSKKNQKITFNFDKVEKLNKKLMETS